MGLYKMDFFDKLVISITLVISTIVCIFNTFSFADTSVFLDNIDGLFPSEGKLVEVINAKAVGFYAYPGHTYIIRNDSDSLVAGSCSLDSFPSPGSSCTFIFRVESGSSVSYTFDDYTYVFFYTSSNSTVRPVISVLDSSPGLKGVSSSLVSNVGVSSLWNIFEFSVPYIGVVVLSSFGFYFVFHNVRELSKGKEKM